MKKLLFSAAIILALNTSMSALIVSPSIQLPVSFWCEKQDWIIKISGTCGGGGTFEGEVSVDDNGLHGSINIRGCVNVSANWIWRAEDTNPTRYNTIISSEAALKLKQANQEAYDQLCADLREKFGI